MGMVVRIGWKGGGEEASLQEWREGGSMMRKEERFRGNGRRK